jgi:hypothetical protein
LFEIVAKRPWRGGWILDAHARGESWTLRLPGAPQLAGAGPEHLSQCLGRLALFGHREPGP